MWPSSRESRDRALNHAERGDTSSSLLFLRPSKVMNQNATSSKASLFDSSPINQGTRPVQQQDVSGQAAFNHSVLISYLSDESSAFPAPGTGPCFPDADRLPADYFDAILYQSFGCSQDNGESVFQNVQSWFENNPTSSFDVSALNVQLGNSIPDCGSAIVGQEAQVDVDYPPDSNTHLSSIHHLIANIGTDPFDCVSNFSNEICSVATSQPEPIADASQPHFDVSKGQDLFAGGSLPLPSMDGLEVASTPRFANDACLSTTRLPAPLSSPSSRTVSTATSSAGRPHVTLPRRKRSSLSAVSTLRKKNCRFTKLLLANPRPPNPTYKCCCDATVAETEVRDHLRKAHGIVAGVGPLKCPWPKCKSVFKGQDPLADLRKHFLSAQQPLHLGKSIACPMCDVTMARVDQLRSHFYRMHPRTPRSAKAGEEDETSTLEG
ncbi:hypothetical protein PM082_018758 [Marasmius tenuissimus]|nr:hypothetical protein PM082_018758 [Marasmius tenuissimus]